MSGQQDKRQTPRVEVPTNVSVFQRSDLSYMGLLLNCSSEGLLISTYEALPPGTVIDLEMVDVRPDTDLHRTGYCTVKVVWSKAVTPSLYTAGCELQSACPVLSGMFRSYQESWVKKAS